MWNTFAALWPSVKEGGFFIAEDLHGCLHHKQFMLNKGAADMLCDQAPDAPSMFMVLHMFKESGTKGAAAAKKFGLPRLPVWESFKDEFDFIDFFSKDKSCHLLPYGDHTSENCQGPGVTAVIQKKFRE
jgi:hypothetical protein